MVEGWVCTWAPLMSTWTYSSTKYLGTARLWPPATEVECTVQYSIVRQGKVVTGQV